jgi:hypothetical protein
MALPAEEFLSINAEGMKKYKNQYWASTKQ